MGVFAGLAISALFLVMAAGAWVKEGDRLMAGVFLCYAIANVLLTAKAFSEH